MSEALIDWLRCVSSIFHVPRSLKMIDWMLGIFLTLCGQLRKAPILGGPTFQEWAMIRS
jgi:hypothetical protein